MFSSAEECTAWATAVFAHMREEYGQPVMYDSRISRLVNEALETAENQTVAVWELQSEPDVAIELLTIETDGKAGCTVYVYGLLD